MIAHQIELLLARSVGRFDKRFGCVRVQRRVRGVNPRVLVSLLAYGDDRHVYTTCETVGCANPDHLATEAKRVTDARARIARAEQSLESARVKLMRAWNLPRSEVVGALAEASLARRDVARARARQRARARVLEG